MQVGDRLGPLWRWVESAKKIEVLIDSQGGAGLAERTQGSVDCSVVTHCHQGRCKSSVMARSGHVGKVCSLVFCSQQCLSTPADYLAHSWCFHLNLVSFRSLSC